jgi:glucosylceramidase
MKNADYLRVATAPGRWGWGLALALLLTACGTPNTSPNPGGTGGASATGTGGSTGASGATGASGTTGAAGTTEAGGTTGTSGTTGTGGNPGDPGTGGSSTSGAGGAAGSAAGTSGAAGSAGGTVGTGGAAGTTPPAEPKLVTSAQNAYWKVGTLTEVTSGTADVTVNDATVMQNWLGFGGTFNEVGWNVLSLLSPADRDRAMQLLFDPTNGAGFTYGRIPIGASDYAINRYTDDESPGDTTMTNFTIDRDKMRIVPYVQAALAINPSLHLWASPWSPPTWMKDNGTFDGGNMKEDATTLQANALYLARWVEEYTKLGIKIEAIHPQNEPGYSTRYPSCLWTAAGYTKFIGSYLGPTFVQRGITTSIFVGTMSNNDAGKDGTIITTVNADTTATTYVKGYGLQWNMLPVVSGLKARNLAIYQTEHKCGNYPWNPSGFPAFNPNMAPNDYPYAIESWGYIRDWIKAGVNVYSAWNMVLDIAGKNLDSMTPWPQNALLTVDTTAKTLNITPAYYIFRHVAEYVDRGAQVVGTTGGDAIAFKNPDGTIVVIMYNSGAAKTYTVALAGKKEQFPMPAQGFATINWK